MAVVLWLVSGPVLTDDRLWLPADKRGLAPLLEDAAERARSTQRCAEVLRGSWNARHSTPDRDAFMVICRDVERASTYYLIYRQKTATNVALLKEQPRASGWEPGAETESGPESSQSAAVAQAQPPDSAAGGERSAAAGAGNDRGESEAALAEVPSGDPRPAPVKKQGEGAGGDRAEGDQVEGDQVEGESAALAESGAQGTHRKSPDPATSGAGQPAAEESSPPAVDVDSEQAWERCLRALEQRVSAMLDVVIYRQPRPEPQPLESGWRYRIDFDARNPRGDNLYFQAACEVSGAAAQLELKPRRD